MARPIELPSGSWRVRIRKKGITATHVAPTKQLALAWALQREEWIKAGIYDKMVAQEGEQVAAEKEAGKAAKKNTVAFLSSRFLREYTAVHKRKYNPNIKHGDHYTFKKINEELGELPVSELTPKRVVEFINHRKIQGYAADTINKQVNLLSRMLDYYHLGEDLKLHNNVNPVPLAKKMVRPSKVLSNKNDERDRRFKAGEEDVLYNSEIGHIVEFAVETCMRRNEIVNLDKCSLVANGKKLLIPNGKEFRTKTDEARSIPLSKRARAIYRKHAKGFGIGGQRLSQVFHRVCKANGIKNLRFHDLRHEGTSRLFEQGWDIPHVAEVTGHSDWKSLKRYCNLDTDDMADRMGKGGIGAPPVEERTRHLRAA